MNQALVYKILTSQIEMYYGQYRMGFFIGTFLMGAMFCFHFKNRIGYLASALLAWTLGSALWTLEFPVLPYNALTKAYQVTAGQCFAEVILAVAFFCIISDRLHERLMKLFSILVMIQLACVWARIRGPMIAPSFDLAVAAIYLPFAPAWLQIVIVGTILTHHAGTADLILASEFFAWSLKHMRPKYIIASGVLAVAAFLAVAYFHSHAPMLDGLERISQYKRFMRFWLYGPGDELIWPFILAGVGAGTFTWCSILIDKFQDPVVLFLHSDWLQILFELGSVGFLLSLGVWFQAVRRMWSRTEYVAALFGVAACGMFYHPLRFAPSIFLLGLIFRKALIQEYK